jgi:hypothetical protein
MTYYLVWRVLGLVLLAGWSILIVRKLNEHEKALARLTKDFAKKEETLNYLLNKEEALQMIEDYKKLKPKSHYNPYYYVDGLIHFVEGGWHLSVDEFRRNWLNPLFIERGVEAMSKSKKK